jgi:hypothetical protein
MQVHRLSEPQHQHPNTLADSHITATRHSDSNVVIGSHRTPATNGTQKVSRLVMKRGVDFESNLTNGSRNVSGEHVVQQPIPLFSPSLSPPTRKKYTRNSQKS